MVKPNTDSALLEMRKTSTARAILVRIVRRDDTEHHLTTYDMPIPYEGNEYIPDVGLQHSAVESTNSFDVDNLELVGIVGDQILEDWIVAGFFDKAVVEVLRVHPADPEGTAQKLRRGDMGRVRATRTGFKFEVRGLVERLRQNRNPLYLLDCGNDFMDIGGRSDSNCGARSDVPTWLPSTAYTVRPVQRARDGSEVKPSAETGLWARCDVAGTSGGSEPTWPTTVGGTVGDGGVTWSMFEARLATGSVVGIGATGTNSVVVQMLRAFTDDHFKYGLLTFTSGNNLNVTPREIRVSKATLTGGGEIELTLFDDIPLLMAVGDTISVRAGCSKELLLNCRDRHDNTDFFRGYPWIPGRDANQTPDATGVPTP